MFACINIIKDKKLYTALTCAFALYNLQSRKEKHRTTEDKRHDID